MRDDLPGKDETLNDLLSRWHRWSCGYTFGKGYPTADSACRSARASRQYDDQNGALDAVIEQRIMEAVVHDPSKWLLVARMSRARASSLIEYTLAFCAEHGVELRDARQWQVNPETGEIT